MRAEHPVENLHRVIAHAAFSPDSGFPVIVYQDRDWEHYRKTREDLRISKTRPHSEHDIEVYAMFAQTWGSTALGFGGLGGQAITDAYTTVLKSCLGMGYSVYFGGRFAYHINQPNDQFFKDIAGRCMSSVKTSTGSAVDLYEQPRPAQA